MQVKLFKWSNALEFASEDKTMKNALEKFKNRIDLSDWYTPDDIMKSFRTADTLTCKGQPFNRIIFNIGGNKYRMICGYKFGKNNVVLYIRFLGNHKTYNTINPCKVNMF